MGGPYDGRDTDGWACGVVLYALITGQLPFDPVEGEWSEREERKRRMMRIAKAEYSWPVGSVVARLLVRDPKKRARVGALWDEEWMRGPGGVDPPIMGRVETGVGLVDVDEGGRRRVMDGFLVDGDGIGELALAEEEEI